MADTGYIGQLSPAFVVNGDIVDVAAKSVCFPTPRTSRPMDSKMLEIASVRDYGAKGDGVTDDSVAIQTAINNASRVYVPPGLYVISRSIRLGNNAYLYGAGSGGYDNSGLVTTNPAAESIFALKNGSNVPLIVVVGGARTGVVRDIQLNGNHNNQAGTVSHGIYFESGSTLFYSGWKIVDVFAHHCNGSGFYADSFADNVNFTRCISFSNDLDGFTINAPDCIVTDCVAGQNTFNGVNINSSDAEVHGGAYFTNRSRGITVNANARNTIITNCQIDFNYTGGVAVSTPCVCTVVSECVFVCNAVSAPGTSDVLILDTSGTCIVTSCSFGTSAVSKPSYNIGYQAGGLARVANCTFDSGAATVANTSFTGYVLDGATAATATAGGGQATPGTVLGYIEVNLNGTGTMVKIPYYAA